MPLFCRIKQSHLIKYFSLGLVELWGHCFTHYSKLSQCFLVSVGETFSVSSKEVHQMGWLRLVVKSLLNWSQLSSRSESTVQSTVCDQISCQIYKFQTTVLDVVLYCVFVLLYYCTNNCNMGTINLFLILILIHGVLSLYIHGPKLTWT